MASSVLSDKGIAVFAFAAYHQLSASGEVVTNVVLHDGAGHAADPEAIEELKAAGLATVDHDRAVFTDDGKAMLAKIVDAIRSAGR